MNLTSLRSCGPFLALVFAAACASSPGATTPGDAGAGSPASAGPVPRVVQPGAPGQASRTFEQQSLAATEGAAYTDADVRFMQGMIHHHAQALQMTALVRPRSTNRPFQLMALRMEISQTDEIAMMRSWLTTRGLAAAQGNPRTMELMMMPGMLSPEQMGQLVEAEGVEFERLFLEFMIQHHTGAITMVSELFSTPGAGQETTINFFASEVDSDQTIEIQRMRQMLEERR